MSRETLFARQPIYDRNNTVYAFELLYRGNLLKRAYSQAKQATTEVLINFCTGLVEDNSVSGRPVFLNVDEEFITSNAFLPLPPENLVIEVLETVKPTPQVIKSLTTLKRQGYTLALDDFVFDAGSEAFFPLVSIIKVDVLGMDISTLKHQLQQFNFADKTLLAEKVEDQAMYDVCRALGFDLFQGYYLERPSMIKGRNFASSKQTLLSLVAKLCKEDVDIAEVTDLISADPSLVLKILRIVNCPIYPFKSEVISLREAVIKLGLVAVKQWVMMLSLVASSEQPKELFRTLLVRAKACNLLALKTRQEDAEGYFMVGLFSGLDAILGIEMSALIDNVYFPPSVKNELLSLHRGDDNILSMVIAYERGLPFSAKYIEELAQAYWEATKWADNLMKLIVLS